jgi:hypothetical protein
MSIKIHFRGPCLFVLDDQKKVEAVVLPYAGPGAVPPEGEVAQPDKPGKHADDSPANVHYSGLLIIGANGKKRRRFEPLRGRVRVSAQGGSDKPPGNLGKVVGVDHVNNGGPAPDLELIPAFDDFSRVAVALSFSGGKMDGEKPSAAEWTVHDDFKTGHTHKNENLVLTQAWESTKPVAIQIVAPDGTTTPEQLSDDEVAYIYNFDDEQPNVCDLEAEEKCESGKTLDDVDFNWLYQLVVPRTGTLKERLKQMKTDLPRPKAKCPRAPILTPRTSTCFFGSWRG